MIDFSTVKAITIPEGVVTKIVSGVQTLWQKAGFKNLLPLATDTDRKTIYNGIGYLPDYRLSSSGSVSKAAGMFASVFITAVQGDILCIKGAVGAPSTTCYVISYNSSNTKVAHKQIAVVSGTGEWSNSAAGQSYANGVLTIPLVSTDYGTGFNAIRVSAYLMN